MNTFKNLKQLVTNNYKYVSLLVGVAMTLNAGTLYNFSVYAPSLKEQMGYTQTQINMVGTFGDIGLYCAFVMGLLHDKVGHRITSVVSSVLLGGGYLLSVLLIVGSLPFHSYGFLIIFFIMVGLGSFGMNVAAVKLNLSNFKKKHRGKITGLLLSGFGLSSAMYTLMYHRKENNVSSFVLLMAIVTATVCALGGLLMKAEPADENVHDDGGQLLDEKSQDNQEVPENAEEEASMHAPVPLEDTDNQDILPQAHPRTEKDLTVMEVMKEGDFYILFGVFLIGTGAGLMVINNIGSIHLTFEGTEGDDKQTLLVGLLSIFNCLGRILFGTLSDKCQHKMPRPAWLCVVVGLMGLFHFTFFLFPSSSAVTLLAMGTGLAYGGTFATSFTLLSLYFGMEHFGAILGLFSLGPAIGGFCSGLMSGAVYDAHALKGGEDAHCYGPDCYSLSFLITGLLCCLGVLLGFWLTWRRRVK